MLRASLVRLWSDCALSSRDFERWTFRHLLVPVRGVGSGGLWLWTLAWSDGPPANHPRKLWVMFRVLRMPQGFCRLLGTHVLWELKFLRLSVGYFGHCIVLLLYILKPLEALFRFSWLLFFDDRAWQPFFDKLLAKKVIGWSLMMNRRFSQSVFRSAPLSLWSGSADRLQSNIYMTFANADFGSMSHVHFLFVSSLVSRRHVCLFPISSWLWNIPPRNMQCFKFLEAFGFHRHISAQCDMKTT